MYATAIAVMLIGIGMVLLGWIMVLLGWMFFRRPGVAFWTFAPVWRANRYLKPPGATLWIAGIVVALVGVVLLVVSGRT
jgi:hypothetical protein